MGDKLTEDAPAAEELEENSTAEAATSEPDLEKSTPLTAETEGEGEHNKTFKKEPELKLDSSMDFIPEREFHRPTTPLGHLNLQRSNLHQTLRHKELLKLRTLEIDIFRSYGSMWKQDCNLLFQRLVILKRRLKKMQSST